MSCSFEPDPFVQTAVVDDDDADDDEEEEELTGSVSVG
jgi:hypothetical protein